MITYRSWLFASVVAALLAGYSVGANAEAGNEEQQLISEAPYLGYLEAHRGVEKPFALLGGPIKVTVRQTSGGANIALPDYRHLDPRVFNTPQRPRAFAGTPLITGVPPSLRATSDGQYTQLKVKSPFGPAYVSAADGRYSLEAMDVTATDGATTHDTVKMEASWKDDKGNTYAVRCNRVIPHGAEYPVFGGVMTNHILHGSSRIGTPLMPTEYVYVAFWGMGEVLKNGKVLDEGVIVHCMLTEVVRGKDYTLDFDSQVTPTRLMMHLIVPPFVVAEGKFVERPVKTGFVLPDGSEMPFWHVMFSNLVVEGERTAMPAGAIPPTGSASVASEGGPGSKSQQSVVAVKMVEGMRFDPEKLTIRVGQTVEWTNDTAMVHTVTCDPALAARAEDVALPQGAKPFNSGSVEPGKTWKHTFTVAGTYKYFCIPHEMFGMLGQVEVKPAED